MFSFMPGSLPQLFRGQHQRRSRVRKHQHDESKCDLTPFDDRSGRHRGPAQLHLAPNPLSQHDVQCSRLPQSLYAQVEHALVGVPLGEEDMLGFDLWVSIVYNVSAIRQRVLR